MNPFDYSLGEVRKAVIALLVLGLAAAALFIHIEPGFDQAVVILAGEVFAVIGVFAATNHTADDVSKALAQLQGAALTVVGYFATVNPDTVEKIAVLAGAFVSAYAVWRFGNKSRT